MMWFFMGTIVLCFWNGDATRRTEPLKTRNRMRTRLRNGGNPEPQVSRAVASFPAFRKTVQAQDRNPDRCEVESHRYLLSEACAKVRPGFWIGAQQIQCACAI